MKKALKQQTGGSHYKGMVIQPVEFIHANKIGYIPANIIKYACRYDKKGQAETDIKKIIHYAEILLELQKKYKY